jgi:hypothetical protein
MFYERQDHAMRSRAKYWLISWWTGHRQCATLGARTTMSQSSELWPSPGLTELFSSTTPHESRGRNGGPAPHSDMGVVQIHGSP